MPHIDVVILLGSLPIFALALYEHFENPRRKR